MLTMPHPRMPSTAPQPRPPGTDAVYHWAKKRLFSFEPYPAEAWFRAWEPFDTMVSATQYYNAVSWALPPGSVTAAEPWNAPEDSEPLERTVYLFISHAGMRARAAARGGEHFNTRVSYLESAPPPRVTLGDPTWDHAMVTLAASGSEATAAFPVAARRLLQSWGFSGHIEVRPGGLVVHFAGTKPVPAELDRLPEASRQLVVAFGAR